MRLSVWRWLQIDIIGEQVKVSMAHFSCGVLYATDNLTYNLVFILHQFLGRIMRNSDR